MPFAYMPAPEDGELRQGEMLGNIWEYRLRSAAHQNAPTFDEIEHPFSIVLTADCDLFQDFRVRFPTGSLVPNPIGPDSYSLAPALVPFVLLCDLYATQDTKPLFSGSDIWRRAKQNQDEHYHRLLGSGDAVPAELADVLMDFKKVFALPTSGLYQALVERQIVRLARVPPVHIHDLMHRFYGFLSRVGLPE